MFTYSISASFILWFIYMIFPRQGVASSMRDLVYSVPMDKRLDSLFLDFPAVGLVYWKQYDKLRTNFEVRGTLPSQWAYFEWKFKNDPKKLKECLSYPLEIAALDDQFVVGRRVYAISVSPNDHIFRIDSRSK